MMRLSRSLKLGDLGAGLGVAGFFFCCTADMTGLGTGAVTGGVFLYNIEALLLSCSFVVEKINFSP